MIDVLKAYTVHQVFSDTKVETELRLEVAKTDDHGFESKCRFNFKIKPRLEILKNSTWTSRAFLPYF